jgi:hypothetical protein
LGLSAVALPVSGKEPTTHEITIQLPGGGTETIRYASDVAPKVTFAQTPFAVAWPDPVAFSFGPSFAAFDRIAADIDRQMDAFWRQAQTMASWSGNGDLSQAALQNLAPGSSAYSVVSQSFGDKVCTRMTEITSSPNGGKPKVVSRTSGNCDAIPTGALGAPNPLHTRTIAVHNAVPAATIPRTAL